MDLDEVAEHFKKNRYPERLDEKRWREELEEHPLLMTKAPNPDSIPPLVDAVRQLKYGEDCNTPAELAKQYKLDGNHQYGARNYEAAVANYTKGLEYLVDELDETAELKCALYTNRAASYAFLGKHQEAVDDCKAALRINPMNYKARECMQKSLYKLNG